MKPNDLPLAVRSALRAMTYDNRMFSGLNPVTDHSPLWGQWNRGDVPIDPGSPLGYGAGGSRGGIQVRTNDGSYMTVDSTGAFLVGELERLDLTMHEPLVEVSYGRDIDMREDVTIADEVSSFTLTTFASTGSLGTGNGIGNGKAWVGKTSNQIAGVGVDISKIPHALTPWALELKYDIMELESAAKLGRPVDAQKFAALQLKHQMDVDEMVYIGDTSLNATGMLNDASVTPAAVANGAAGSPLWTSKTPAEILTDFNELLSTTWANSAYKIIPDRVGLPTTAYGYLATQPVGIAGFQSIMQYLQANNLSTKQGNGLTIVPIKWLNGAGAGGTLGTGGAGKDRMLAYTKAPNRIRYPMTLLQRTPIQYDGLYHKTTYFCRLGQVELVYPETVSYRDGMS